MNTIQDNLSIHTSTPSGYTGRFGSGQQVSTDKTNIVTTVATFGADTFIDVSTCDGRPEPQIDEVTRNAVRMTVKSSCWDDDTGRIATVITTTALTAKEALSVARDLIVAAQQLMPDEG